MQAVVIYESMFGNTRAIAEAVADGLAEASEVVLLGVAEVGPGRLASADLIVIGGPTHVHGRSRAATRKAATDYAKKDPELVLEPGAAEGPGVRDLAPALAGLAARAAAFDTRIDAPAVVTGRAAKGIVRMCRRAGLPVVAPPESFLVDKRNRLLEGEVDRARAWGRQLVAARTGGAVR